MKLNSSEGGAPAVGGQHVPNLDADRQPLTGKLAKIVFMIKMLSLFAYNMTVYFVTALFNRKKPKNISGKIALVTGGGNGIGKEIAFHLAKEGCNVAICDIDEEAAKSVVATIERDYAVRTRAYRTDVTQYNEIVDLRTAILRDLGTVDILVNNAAILTSPQLGNWNATNIAQMLSVNIASHFWTTDIFIEDMKKKRSGHIVALSSLGGLMPVVRSIVYSTTKFAVRGFMNALELELLHDDQEFIKTTTVFPFFVATQPDSVNLLDTTLPSALPVYRPSYVGKLIVQAIQMNHSKVTVPDGLFMSTVFSELWPAVVLKKVIIAMAGKVPLKAYLGAGDQSAGDHSVGCVDQPILKND